jgi:hypothetical protein
MSAPSKKPTSTPAISRPFEFSRLHDQMLASAYEALIPVVSRQPVCDAHQRNERETSNSTFRSSSHRSVAGA